MRPLTGRELRALRIIGSHATFGVPPSELARSMAAESGREVSWQEASKVAGELVTLGLVKRRSYPKLTLYEIRALGRGYLDVPGG